MKPIIRTHSNSNADACVYYTHTINRADFIAITRLINIHPSLYTVVRRVLIQKHNEFLEHEDLIPYYNFTWDWCTMFSNIIVRDIAEQYLSLFNLKAFGTINIGQVIDKSKVSKLDAKVKQMTNVEDFWMFVQIGSILNKS